MIKVAIIDDGICNWYGKKYPNIKITYLKVKEDNSVAHIKFSKLGHYLNHATMCFLIYANMMEHEVFELFSIKIIGKKDKGGNIDRLVSALQWCQKNNVNLISLSVGSTYYKDYSKLEAILEKLWERNSIMIAAYSNDNKLTYPAASPYALGVRVDTTGVLPVDEYIVLEKGISNCEIILSQNWNNIKPKKCANIPTSFNSFATPVIAAMVHRGFMNNYHSRVEIIKYLRKQASQTELDLWKLRQNNLVQKNIQVPVLVLINESKMSIDLLKKLSILFDSEGYSMFSLYDSEEMPVEQAISINRLLINCDYDYKNLILFAQYYTDADLLIVFIKSLEQVAGLIKDNTIDIVLSQQVEDLECKTIQYKNTLDTTVSLLEKQIVYILSH